MEKFTSKNSYVLFARIVGLLAFAGVAIILYEGFQDNPTDTLFSLIAFVVSVAALLITLVQGVSSSQQLRATQRSAKMVRDISVRVEKLIDVEERLGREIREDMKLDREIIYILEEHGIGDTDKERRAVAESISKRVTKG